MKFIKYIYTLIAFVVMFTSCDVNQMPVFDDKDAFVAFRNATVSAGEETGSIDIPVLLTSLSGISTTVEFEFVAEGATAVEGTNFTLKNATKSLTFTKDAPVQYIRLALIDNTTFDGDVKIQISLSTPTGVKLGASKTTELTITDNEHPLLFILGTYTASAVSYYNGAEEWEVVTSKDPDDLDKIWFTNLVAGGSSPEVPVYGVVSEDKTTILIPVKQIIFLSGSYPLVNLGGYYGPDGSDEIPSGGNITVTVDPDGTLTFNDEFGSDVYSDAAGGADYFLGSINYYESGAVMKKK